VILTDVNLLVYAHNRAAPLHRRAREWWEDLMVRQQPVGLPWAVVLGFIRLVTHPSVLVNPLPPLNDSSRFAIDTHPFVPSVGLGALAR
jgi:predicted nucleic acid-binding protein